MKTALRVLFPGIIWWLAALIPLVVLGFYASYFSRFFSTTGLLHVHFAVLMVWVVLLIVQPLLILRNNLAAHRIAGKASYFIVPAVTVTTWLVITETAGQMIRSNSELSAFEKDSIFIPMIFLFWLTLFYLLAIIFRRQYVDHATYMFSSALTLLGPTLDRILFQIYKYFGVEFNVFAEFFTFAVIDAILVALLVYQFRKGYPLVAVIVSILAYLIGQAAYVFLPESEVWEVFLRALFAYS
jgi:hypothetical protein